MYSAAVCRTPPEGATHNKPLSEVALFWNCPGNSSKGSIMLLYLYSQHLVQAWHPVDVQEVKNELSLPSHLPVFFPFILPLPPGHPPAWSWNRL